MPGDVQPAPSERRLSVEYQRVNGYEQSVPGTLEYWRGYLTDPDHPTEGPTNRRNPVVRLRQRVDVITWEPWEVVAP